MCSTKWVRMGVSRSDDTGLHRRNGQYRAFFLVLGTFGMYLSCLSLSSRKCWLVLRRLYVDGAAESTTKQHNLKVS